MSILPDFPCVGGIEEFDIDSSTTAILSRASQVALSIPPFGQEFVPKVFEDLQGNADGDEVVKVDS
jgi:hypothetical protein